MTFSDWQGVAELASNTATVVAVIVGGIWSYLIFIKNREKYPQASVSHELRAFDLTERLRIVHVAIRIQNTGKVLLPVRFMECRLLQVLPLESGWSARAAANPPALLDKGRQKIAWPLLDERIWKFSPREVELEPGESETLRCDFVLSRTPTLVQVYSHLRNPVKEVIGWACQSGLDLQRKEEMHATSIATT